MVEIIVSAGALCVFSILVQSMLVLGHSFTRSQQNLFDSFQIARTIKQKMCMNNSSFKNINLYPDNSYTKTVASVTKQDADGNDYTIHSRTYIKVNPLVGSTPVPLLGLDILGIEGEVSLKNEAGMQVLMDNVEYVDKETLNNTPQLYKVYQDSHTIIKFNFDLNTINQAGGFLSGYVFASRCMKNQANTIYESSGRQVATFNPNALKKSALHILNMLKYKPYYFPSTDSTVKIQCCTDGAVKSTCAANKDWVPRIYVLHIDPASAPPASAPGFFGKVTYIQELPELQDINNIWGMGFMLSMDSKNIFSQSAFQLDTVVLKNNCIASVKTIQKCKNLSIGMNLAEESLIGVTALKMIDFINPDISSCSGYSAGVDTTSLINL